ncbi:ovarian cancer G-protein coupled receptor 1-like [Scleropages formosus]|uniref:G protein-coupled receptor 68 n=1 Tax=Scleropages formosus TaxID=113540 RepID=A0A0N8JYC6_SCLFO|nr:ovarian cancer G-protein coupled receptor 1-like [Scleropages formosus]KPP66161.1 ovarian cancer G-protein coupled receptor 1-like [Scleropages formosus]
MTNLTSHAGNHCEINHNIHQYLFSSTYIIVLLIGIPTNLYSLYHAFLQTRACNELGIYLLNLTASDLLYLASLPLWLQYFLQDDNWTHKEWLCNVCGFLLYENIYISVGFLCCISIDRFMAIAYPLRSSKFRTMRAASAVSAFIWLKEVAVGVILFQQKELSNDHTNHSLCFEHYPMMNWERYVNYYRFFMGFLFPLGILCASYFWVLRVVNKSSGTHSSQKARIKHLVTGTVVIFLVCFSPYHVLLMVRTLLENDCLFIQRIFNYYQFSLLLTSLNCLADPFLYCFVGENIRRDIQLRWSMCTRLLCCRKEVGYATSSDPATIKESAISRVVPLQSKPEA